MQYPGTIVENSTEGLKRDIAFYKQVSKQTGVHVVAGTGHYIADMQASLSGSVEDIYNHMLRELTEGCIDCVDVKAGFMGEIASVWPLKGEIYAINYSIIIVISVMIEQQYFVCFSQTSNGAQSPQPASSKKGSAAG